MLILRRSPKHNVVSRCSRRYSSVSDFTAKLDNTTFFPVESRHRSTAHSLPRRYGTAKERAERCVTDDGNAFISYNPDATYIPPLAQALRNTSDRYDASIGQYKYKYQSISVAVKDNICTLGSEFPTSCASRSLVGHESPYEATVVTLLKMRGCKVVGKTNMDEFGMGSHSVNSHFGPVAQRYTNAEGEEVRYSAGGSSGGSAVAVQQMLSTAALGTDTGGSVRLPAAWCGVVGFKPSYGLLSRWGVIDYANSFDTVGILARTVTMIDKIFHYIWRSDKQDPTCLPESTTERMFAGKIIEENTTKQWTIGIPIEYNISELSPLVKEAWIDAIELLQANGYKIVPISLPSTKSALSAYYVLAPAEASSNLAKYDGIRYGTRAEGPDGTNGMLYSKTRAEGFGDEVKRRILLGSYSLSADAVDNYFIQAQKVRRLVQMEFNDVFAAPHPLLESGSVFKVASDVDWASGPGLDSELPASSAANEKVDYILCPTAPTPPPRLEDIENQTPVESYINDVFTVPASMAGLPAISIFWGGKASLREKDEKRDPAHNVGLQIIGQFGRDHGVISMAKRMGYYRKTRDGGGS